MTGDPSSYSCGAMGVHIVGGQRRAIMLGTKNRQVAYELDLESGALLQTVSPYGGLMHAADLAAGVQPYGAWFDETRQELAWTFADPYNVGQRSDPSYGTTTWPTMTARGPFFALPDSHHACGYVFDLHGLRAFGAGLASGNAASSWGPYAITETGVELVGYSLANRCRRNSDYIMHGGPDIMPTGARPERAGFWTQDDIVGGAVLVDLPDKQGLVFTGYQAHGHVWYGRPDDIPGLAPDLLQTTGPHAQFRVPTWWIYDSAPAPLDFEEVPVLSTGADPAGFGIKPLLRSTGRPAARAGCSIPAGPRRRR